jgi:hypothetical protein
MGQSMAQGLLDAPLSRGMTLKLNESSVDRRT